MSKITSLVRPNIAALESYSTARDEYTGSIGIFLDANESPFDNGYNRYPDPHQKELKSLIGGIKGIPCANLFLGNGSDEAIDLLFRVFCEPGRDNAVGIVPSYGMYPVAAAMNDIEYRPVMLGEDFSLDTGRLLAAADGNTKLVFLCSPNNPSGNAFPREQLLDICLLFRGVVVVDEAYVDFSSLGSLAQDALGLENLVVLQTLSKARAMAGLRIGMAIASEEIVGLMSGIKYPYNISLPAMQTAAQLLRRDFSAEVTAIVQERKRMSAMLETYPFVQKVYHSEANFLLVKVTDADRLYSFLLERGIIVRNRSRLPGCSGCLRITIGLGEENDAVLAAFNDYVK